jgi:predicted kinase
LAHQECEVIIVIQLILMSTNNYDERKKESLTAQNLNTWLHKQLDKNEFFIFQVNTGNLIMINFSFTK